MTTALGAAKAQPARVNKKPAAKKGRRMTKTIPFCLSLGAVLALTWISPGPAVARTFKSSLPLKVYANGQAGQPDRYLGKTSAGSSGVTVPSSEFWYVRPVGPLTQDAVEELAQEVKSRKIPGVDLSERWDIHDDSLVPFEGIPTLRYLDLTKTRVTNAGLEHIATLTGLRFLALPKPVTDAGLRQIKDLKQLMAIELSETRVTPKGAVALSDLPKLDTVWISRKPITGDDLRALARLNQVRHLFLNGYEVPPAVLEKARSG
jgi:hypothetical protein